MEALANRFETKNYTNNNKQGLIDCGIPASIADTVCFKMAQNARLTSFNGTTSEHATYVMNNKELMKEIIKYAMHTSNL